LEAILVNIGTGVLTTDSDDRIRAANDAAERILGTSGNELIGKTAAELAESGVLPEFFSRLRAGAGDESTGEDGDTEPGRDRRDTDAPIESEIDVIKGSHKRTIKTMQTRLSTEGRYLGMVIVFEDLTELISSKKLSAWVEMSRQIAHEIKNPLTPIKLSAQFMVRAHEEKSSDFDKIFKESADTIIHQVEVLRNISREFSSFGRLQQLHLVVRPVVPLLKEIVAPYQRNSSGVDVTLHTPNEELTAILDPEALRKICTNLIENAMESMSNGGEMTVTCDMAQNGDDEMVRITVTDTGPGLDDEAAERLFEPYFSTKTTGTGLGLAICRNLSREMGGDVTVENLPDRAGVKATLYLKPA
jgi:two-component system nitrogen regulation sensor histidine kinase NtrY